MRNQLSLVLVLVSATAFAGTPDHPVVGGSTVASGAYPDVALVVAPMALCSGTLIAPDVVLTAGHCIDTHPTEVLLGSVDYTKVGGEVIAVKSATAYPSWQTEFDVGVLVLDHASAAAPRPIASACTAKDLEAGNDVTVVGFGLTDAAGTGQNTKLHQAKLVVDDPACTSDAACNATIAPNAEFVAGGGGIDACFGDSGGPIYLDDALIGVVSRGMGTSGEPCGGGGIYVRADRVVSWIESTTHRKITRSTCDAKVDDAGSNDPQASSAAGAPGEVGGCSTASGAVGWLALALVVGAALLLARRSA
ncbi:MAG: trypsin-like serine protease [Kofleriaceae bacterium]